MNDNWPIKRFGDIAEFRNGLNFTRASRGAAVKVIGVGTFLDNETLSDFSDVPSVVTNSAIKDDDLLAEDDLLFVRSNGNKKLVGRCVLVKNLEEPIAFSGFTIRARLKSTEVDPRYFSKVVHSPLFKHHLNRLGGGSSISNLSQPALASFEFPLPSLLEQLKIAEVLHSWDGAIEKLMALRTAKGLRRNWIRAELLTGKRRLAGFSGAWSEVRLSEVLTEHKARSSGEEEVFSVSVHKGLVNQIDHLGRSFAAKSTSHYNRVLPGDIVYTKSPTGDFPLGIIKQSTIALPVIVSPLYGVFSPKTHDLGVILSAHFESPVAVRNYLSPLVQKGAKNTIAITNQRFLEGRMKLPLDPAEQSAIARLLETDQLELNGIDAELAALRQQKRGLMQKLLTGQWRVEGEVTP